MKKRKVILCIEDDGKSDSGKNDWHTDEYLKTTLENYDMDSAGLVIKVLSIEEGQCQS